MLVRAADKMQLQHSETIFIYLVFKVSSVINIHHYLRLQSMLKLTRSLMHMQCARLS